ncbi:Alpha/beta hydrolase [Candidatus Desulfarcum epimagneticum]|uniref:Alpha/beta hydrolase n=1 Tax=uncultured Desulfobacteraceae bacterium TaxID=218296 RepID=A0A484HGT4_9BACT|nr:Alpha/beta hydrolase [uncultured Desulfobacteraceae bacterium]
MTPLNDIRVGGKRLEALWHGPSPEEAATLVFLHEGLGCAEMWHDFPARLADASGCGALVYSRAGYGGSDPCGLPRPVRFMHDEALEILPRVLERVGVRDFFLVGHSDGASISLIYSGTRSGAGSGARSGNRAGGARLKGLIALAPHALCEEATLRAIEEISETFKKGPLRRKLAKYHGAGVDGAFWGWSDVWLHPDFKNWNIEKYLPGISAPVLVVQGQNDPYGTRVHADSIVARVRGSVETLMLEDCGHSPHQEKSAETLDAMTRFIRRAGG